MIRADESLGNYIQRRKRELEVDPKKCLCGGILEVATDMGECCIHLICKPCDVLIVESVT